MLTEIIHVSVADEILEEFLNSLIHPLQTQSDVQNRMVLF